jgi:Zn-dependent peptidase ImmA (M78 family)
MAWVRSPISVLRDIGITSPKDIELELIAFSLNAEVVYEPLHGYEANIFGTDQKAIITVNRDSTDSRKRFSLAHEIGHWTNDRGRNLSIECTSGDMRQKELSGVNLNAHQSREARANRFASQLLMPDFMIEPLFSSIPVNYDSVKEIADTFSTSLTSSASRLIQITQRPSMITMWNRDGARRWFSRSSSLSEQIWPNRSIDISKLGSMPLAPVSTQENLWMDYPTSSERHIQLTAFDNGVDIIILFSW